MAKIEKLTPLELSRLNNRILMDHIKSGDDAHGLADTEHAGFMSAWQVAELNSAYGYRTWAGNSVDLFKLDPGHYEVQNPQNVPDGVNGFCSADIAINPAGVRTIWLYQENVGRLFFYAKDYGTKNVGIHEPDGWSRIWRRFTAWQGSLSKVGDAASITLDATNYDYAEYHFDDGSSQNIIRRIPAQNATIICTSLLVGETDVSDAVQKMTLLRSGEKYAVQKIFHYSHNESSYTNTQADCRMALKQIDFIR